MSVETMYESLKAWQDKLAALGKAQKAGWDNAEANTCRKMIRELVEDITKYHIGQLNKFRREHDTRMDQARCPEYHDFIVGAAREQGWLLHTVQCD